MKNTMYTMAAVLLLAGSALAGNPEVNTSGATGIAINGYDPVAFFTEKKPVNGDPAIKAEHEGATYLFASEKHRDLFVNNPEKYAPQFGGYCAYGVSMGALFPVDINTWQVREGKLYLNLNPEILKAFNKDFDDNLAKARANWPKVLNGKKN